MKTIIDTKERSLSGNIYLLFKNLFICFSIYVYFSMYLDLQTGLAFGFLIMIVATLIFAYYSHIIILLISNLAYEFLILVSLLNLIRNF